MTPIIVTPPTEPIVLLDEMSLHLRVDTDDDLTLIQSLCDAATAYLDGWSGILGRCVMPQTWRVSVAANGTVVLPMPNVTAALADYGAGPVALDVTDCAAGPMVAVTGACTITFTCALPDRLVPQVQTIVKLLVGHWYANREGVGQGAAELPLAVDALVSAMRWRRI